MSGVKKDFSDKILARVVYISTGGNSPDDAISPKASQGFARRKVRLHSGSSSNKGGIRFSNEDGPLKQIINKERKKNESPPVWTNGF